MKSIAKETVTETIIKKSTFICHLKSISSIDEAKIYIDTIKSKHHTASHNCSAYIIDTLEKCDDDGEPNQTAGLPILNVLKHHNLNNICCVITRYFGGIKLGAGGLIRAYAKSTANGIENSDIINFTLGNVITIEFDYTHNKIFDHRLEENNFQIVNKEYAFKVKYTLHITKDKYLAFSKLVNSIDHLTTIEIKDEIYMLE